MCKPELADSSAVVAIAVGRNEIELASIGEILGLARADSLVPDCFEGERGGRAKIGITTDVYGLHPISIVNTLIVVEFDCLQLEVDKKSSPRRVQLWVLLDKFMKVIQVRCGMGGEKPSAANDAGRLHAVDRKAHAFIEEKI